MIVTCNQCATKFRLEDRHFHKSAFNARCSMCNNVFTVYGPSRVAEISFIDLSTAMAANTFHNIIAVSNQKGGVAKTSTCLNLGAALALLNKRVLLIDFDVQSNLTISLGYHQVPSFYEVISSEKMAITDVILKTQYPNLALLPSNKNMVLLNKKYFGAKNFEYLLKDRLGQVKDQYDAIIIDTPPSIEFFTLNALSAANLVIIPCQCEYLATHGVNQIVKLIDLIKRKTNAHIDARILITMYDPQDTVANLVCSKLKEMYHGQSFDVMIHKDAKLKESQVMSMPAYHYSKQSRAGQQYMDLAREIMSNSKVWSRASTG